MQSIRRGGFTAAAALAAALGAWLAPREALAGSATEKRDLHPPIGAAADATTPATGNVEGRENRRGRTLDVKVRNLAPRRAYEVRSLGDDRTLTTFTTNRRGRGTAKYRDEAPAPAPRAGGQALEVSFNFDFEFNFEFNFDGGTGDGSGDGTGIDWTDPSNWPDGSDWIDPGTDPDACGFDWYCVQILDAETGECVLTCDGDEHDGCGDPVEYRFESGFDVYCGDDGEFAYATMSRTQIGEDVSEYFSVSLEVPTDDCHFWDATLYQFDATDGTGLPLGVESVRDLAGRQFEIRDGGGNALIAGVLPELVDYGGFEIYGSGVAFPDGGDNGGIDFPPPPSGDPSEYVLWIADGEGTLQEAGTLYEVVFDVWVYGEPGDGTDGWDTGNWDPSGVPAGAHR